MKSQLLVNRVAAVAFGTVSLVAGAIAYAQCLQNSTVPCCTVSIDAPSGPVPCGETTCFDIVIANPSLDYVIAGDRKPTAWVSPSPTAACKFDDRICVGNKRCVSVGTVTSECNGTRFTASQACP